MVNWGPERVRDGSVWSPRALGMIVVFMVMVIGSLGKGRK